MKKLVFMPIFFATIVVLTTQCLNKQTANAPKAQAVINPLKMTHKEGADTLRIDSTAPLKPLNFKALNSKEAMAFLTENNLDTLFHTGYPLNGFYGEDRYRIEYLFETTKRDDKDPTLFHVKGRNRYKKVITAFEGTIRITQLSEFTDPNLDTIEVNDMHVKKFYAAQGEFELKEDPTLKTSGVFKGKLKMEFNTRTDEYPIDFWFQSEQLPSGGGGYRMDGTWTSYVKKDMVKPVILAHDLFRFANDILKDFSYGEREVEINPKYRSLGWESFWENDEWWHEAEKPKM
jgi:hypothetical protein